MKTNQLLSSKEIVEITGLTYSEVSHILNGRRRVSKRQARLLAKTGWPELTWLYPEDYPGNPYLQNQKS